MIQNLRVSGCLLTIRISKCLQNVQFDNITPTCPMKLKYLLTQLYRERAGAVDFNIGVQSKGVLFDQRLNQEGEIAKPVHICKLARACNPSDGLRAISHVSRLPLDNQLIMPTVFYTCSLLLQNTERTARWLKRLLFTHRITSIQFPFATGQSLPLSPEKGRNNWTQLYHG